LAKKKKANSETTTKTVAKGKETNYFTKGANVPKSKRPVLGQVKEKGKEHE